MLFVFCNHECAVGTQGSFHHAFLPMVSLQATLPSTASSGIPAGHHFVLLCLEYSHFNLYQETGCSPVPIPQFLPPYSHLLKVPYLFLC